MVLFESTVTVLLNATNLLWLHVIANSDWSL